MSLVWIISLRINEDFQGFHSSFAVEAWKLPPSQILFPRQTVFVLELRHCVWNVVAFGTSNCCLGWKCSWKSPTISGRMNCSFNADVLNLVLQYAAVLLDDWCKMVLFLRSSVEPTFIFFLDWGVIVFQRPAALKNSWTWSESGLIVCVRIYSMHVGFNRQRSGTAAQYNWNWNSQRHGRLIQRC